MWSVRLASGGGGYLRVEVARSLKGRETARLADARADLAARDDQGTFLNTGAARSGVTRLEESGAAHPGEAG